MKRRTLHLDHEYFPEQPPGCAGFGCGFLLAFALLFRWWLASDWSSPTNFLGPPVLAVLAGLAVARFGERFFRKVLDLFFWWWWP
ncbi:hypothetical protein [Thermoanaerobaculum aquaticum]|jgi:hypothetical protein|uniref:Uncharacterized protein n=1 Tax=Thermoanaerobaculum aquaticum TaxID=1312852 RepID=A0A7C2SPY2_9BACT|nr:hypothetical protein [Thermoanaerobaculum aquaticum]